MDVASIPCCRLQKGILAGVLNTELDDVVIELLFFILFISVHHSAGMRHRVLGKTGAFEFHIEHSYKSHVLKITLVYLLATRWQQS